MKYLKLCIAKFEDNSKMNTDSNTFIPSLPTSLTLVIRKDEY